MKYKSITAGITVSVKPRFERIAFVEKSLQYVFSYQVDIENHSDKSVKLLSRRWIIVDGHGIKRIVEGDGVIGKQPTLRPGDSHAYSSWCPLPTPVGKMLGHYNMAVIHSDDVIEVEVPEFLFNTPFQLN